MTDIEQLLAREHIKQVRARYFRCVDSRDWDGFMALFRPDAVLDLTDDLGRKFCGHDEILTVVRGIEGSVSVHHGHTPEIEFASATRASGIWAMEDMLFWAPGSKSRISKLRGRLLLIDPTFGDGVSARLYGGDARMHAYGQAAGEWLETPERYYRVPGTSFSKENAPPYMVSMGWMFQDMIRTIAEGGPGSPSFEEACHAHCVVEVVELSQKSRRWIRIDEFGSQA